MKDSYGVFSGLKVLLVEDMVFFQEIVKAMVELTLLQVECAANGVEAVSMFEQFPDEYDLILMNIEMPEMDGYEATRRIRSFDHPRAKEIPIIAFSGHNRDEIVDKCMASGMNGYIGRPIGNNAFVDELGKYLK
jgi:CheY-like chemotaxis protein